MNALPIDMAEADAEIIAMPPAKRAELALQSSNTERDLLALLEKHQAIKAIKDKAGRDQAHGAYMEVKNARIDIEKVSKGARDDAVQFSQAIIAEEKRLVGVINGEESRLKALRDGWDAEQERIKREAIAQEQARISGLKARIQEIKDLSGLAMQCRSSERVLALKDRITAINLDGMQEFGAQADAEKSAALEVVEAILQTRISQEAEAARIKAEREELERQQAEAKKREDEQRAIAESLAAERAALERERAAFEAAKQQDPVRDPNMDGLAFVMPPVKVDDPSPVLSDKTTADRNANEFIDRIEQVKPMAAVNAIGDPVISNPPWVAPADDMPTAQALINAIADRFTVSSETACQWLIENADEFEIWQPA